MYFRKLYKLLIIALFVISAAQSGCKKYEPVPLEPITEDLVYDKMDINGYYADRALTNLYTFLPDGFNRVSNSFLDLASDDGVTSQYANDIELLSQGLQSPTKTVDDSFADNYLGINRANLFLSKIDVVPINDGIKKYWKAEARFIRAMVYFELIKRYGGIPLIGDQVLTISDNINIERSSYDKCVEYIVAECDAISGLLKKEPVTAVELGRITEGAALALKSRVLLYAASPLNNPANDLSKWQSAADAAKAVIDLNYYALHANFVTLFTTRSTKETILAFQRAKNSSLEKANSPVGYTTDLFTSSGLASPTQELVEAFPTINGKSIMEDIKSGGNLNGFDSSNPYANRDPRFNATIFYNGSNWLGRSVETFEGGLDKPGGALVQTRTGYYLRKFLPDLSTGSNYGSIDHNFIIFRYAETLLNYAEAINEASSGNTALAQAQLILLRKRAGIAAGAGSLYGLKPAMTQQEMREAIKLERRLELAFEEHRFWDVRRWKTAENDFNKTLHGVKITQSTPGVFTYQTIDVAPIVFKTRMYLYPIPFSELLSNRALTQNNGW